MKLQYSLQNIFFLLLSWLILLNLSWSQLNLQTFSSQQEMIEALVFSNVHEIDF